MATPVVDFVGGNVVFDGVLPAASTSITFNPGTVTTRLLASAWCTGDDYWNLFHHAWAIGGCGTSSCFDVGGSERLTSTVCT